MSTNTPGRSLYVRLQGPDCGPGAAGKWTDAATGEHGDLLDLIARNRDLHRLARRHGRGALLSRPAAPARANFSARSRPRRPDRPEAARRLFRCRPPGSRHAGRGLSARTRHHRPARLARPALPPVGLLPRSRRRSARTVAGAARRRHRSRRHHHRHPAHLARSARGPAKAPLADPRRALGHLLGNGVRFGASACRHPRRRRRRRDHARAQIRAAAAAHDRRALGQPSRRPRPAPGAAPSLCRARQRCGRPSMRRNGCANAAQPASKSASSCRCMATSISISAVSAPTACSRISRISSSRPTGAISAR